LKISVHFNPESNAGIKELVSNFETEIIKIMSMRYKRFQDIAKKLKVSPSTAHRLLKKIGESKRNKIKKKDLEKNKDCLNVWSLARESVFHAIDARDVKSIENSVMAIIYLIEKD